MTLANRITIARLALIPVYLLLLVIYTQEEDWLRWLAFAMFLLMAISDGVDGYIARHYNQHSKLGAVLDPLADKTLVNLSFIVLAANREFEMALPYWFPIAMLTRDIILTVGAALIHEFVAQIKTVKPRFPGKLNTVCQIATIIAVLIALPWTPYIVYVATVVGAVSLLDYIYDGFQRVQNQENA